VTEFTCSAVTYLRADANRWFAFEEALVAGDRAAANRAWNALTPASREWAERTRAELDPSTREWAGRAWGEQHLERSRLGVAALT
jgi:hypothetical protein